MVLPQRVHSMHSSKCCGCEAVLPRCTYVKTWLSREKPQMAIPYYGTAVKRVGIEAGRLRGIYGSLMCQAKVSK